MSVWGTPTKSIMKRGAAVRVLKSLGPVGVCLSSIKDGMTYQNLATLFILEEVRLELICMSRIVRAGQDDLNVFPVLTFVAES